MTVPMITLSTTVAPRPTYGTASVNGKHAEDRGPDHRLRPMRSPIGPPRIVPIATAARKTNW